MNTRKSAVDRPWKRSFLSFTLSRKGQRLKVADNKAISKLKAQIRTLSRRTRGHSLARPTAHGPWRLNHSPALRQALPAQLFRSYGLPELAVR